jgi:hypothetical protein
VSATSADILSDEEILSRYIDKDKFPEEFKFTLGVIEGNVQKELNMLRESLNIQTNA